MIALKETCRVAPDRTIPLWLLHRARLTAGGCTSATLERVEAAVADAAASYSAEMSSRIRLTVTVAEEGAARASVVRRLSSLDVIDGVRAVAIVQERLPELPAGAAKPVDRSYWDAAQRAAKAAGGDQAVLVGPDGIVIDGGTASVFVRIGNRTLLTPPAPPAVAGVARAWILGHAEALGYECRVEAFSYDDLERADEAFFSNAFGGIRGMRGRGGPASAALGEAFGAVLGGSVRNVT